MAADSDIRLRAGEVAGSPAVSPLLPRLRRDWVRLALVPVFVGACYLLPWTLLRAWDCSVLTWLLEAAGFAVEPVGRFGFSTRGVNYQFVTSCTAVDASWGSIPLLWRPRETWARNLRRLLPFFLAVMAVNILRLWIGFVMLRHGIAWVWGHEAIAGVFYFAMLSWIAHERGWLSPAGPRASR